MTMRQRYMLGLFLGVLVAGVSAGAPDAVKPQASPADVPAVTTADSHAAGGSEWNWTGFYLGVHSGYGWSKFKNKITPQGNYPTEDFLPQTLNRTALGSLPGLQAGYNYQLNPFVLGIEGDFDGAGMSATARNVVPSMLTPSLGVNGFMVNDDVNWVTSLRARLGYATGRNLFYLTAGGALENITRNSMAIANVGPNVYGVAASSSDSYTRPGLVAGAGYERILSDHWSLRGEYLFYKFRNIADSELQFVPAGNGPASARVATDDNIVNVFRVGLDYKFGDDRHGSEGLFDKTMVSRGDYSSCWAGPYIGVNAGYALSSFNNRMVPEGVTPTEDFIPQTLSGEGHGGVAGCQIGYNYLLNPVVLGIEGDFDGAGMSSTDSTLVRSLIVPSNGENGFIVNNKINWLSSVRARFGYAMGRCMPYLTGGMAWENITRTSMAMANVAPDVFGVTTSSSDNYTKPGFVVGCGYERLLTARWSVRGEYLLYKFDGGGSKDMPFVPNATGPGAARISSDGNLVSVFRLGLNCML